MAIAPGAVPVREAATVMIVDDRPDLHVLLLRRRAASDFVGGMYVFPGGAVDLHDAALDVEALCGGLSDAVASERLGVARGGLAYWVAAIRETFEEAGVLLARHAGTARPLDPCEPGVAEWLAGLRPAVDRDEVRLADAVREAKLELAADAIRYAARWITPVGPPRRYDTRFFVTAMPHGQTPVADHREAVHSEWVRPAEALTHFFAGERSMLPPTVGMLRILANFSTSAQVMDAAAQRERGPDVPVRLAASAGEAWSVLLPAESLRDAPPGARLHAMQAWVRLLPPEA